jgi:hypothetical protein
MGYEGHTQQATCPSTLVESSIPAVVLSDAPATFSGAHAVKTADIFHNSNSAFSSKSVNHSPVAAGLGLVVASTSSCSRRQEMCGDDTKVSPVSLLGSGGPRAMLKHKLLSTAGSAPASAWSLVPKAVTVHASRAVLVPTAGVMPDAWPKVALPYAHRTTAGVQTQLAVDPVPSELPRAIPPSNVTCSRTPKLQAAGGDPLLVPYWLHECKARPQRRLHLSLVAQRWPGVQPPGCPLRTRCFRGVAIELILHELGMLSLPFMVHIRGYFLSVLLQLGVDGGGCGVPSVLRTVHCACMASRGSCHQVWQGCCDKLVECVVRTCFAYVLHSETKVRWPCVNTIVQRCNWHACFLLCVQLRW